MNRTPAAHPKVQRVNNARQCAVTRWRIAEVLGDNANAS